MSHDIVQRWQDQTKMQHCCCCVSEYLNISINDCVKSGHHGSHHAVLRCWHQQGLGYRVQVLCHLPGVFLASLIGADHSVLNTMPWRRNPQMWFLLSIRPLTFGCNLIPFPQVPSHVHCVLRFLSLSWGQLLRAAMGCRGLGLMRQQKLLLPPHLPSYFLLSVWTWPFDFRSQDLPCLCLLGMPYLAWGTSSFPSE